MANVKIDGSCIYVPIKYKGNKIVIVEKGEDIDNHHSQAQIKSLGDDPSDSSLAWGNHQGKAKYGVEYDIYQWRPRKYIGTAKWSSESSNYNVTKEKKGCWSIFLKILKWLFVIFVIIIVLALLFAD